MQITVGKINTIDTRSRALLMSSLKKPMSENGGAAQPGMMSGDGDCPASALLGVATKGTGVLRVEVRGSAVAHNAYYAAPAAVADVQTHSIDQSQP